MAKQPTEQIAEATSEALTKSGDAAEKIMEGNAEALTESGTSSRAAIQELTKAYQELAAKNAKNLTAAMQSLAAVKSPTEFMELQQRLIKEGVQAAVSDSQPLLFTGSGAFPRFWFAVILVAGRRSGFSPLEGSHFLMTRWRKGTGEGADAPSVRGRAGRARRASWRRGPPRDDRPRRPGARFWRFR